MVKPVMNPKGSILVAVNPTRFNQSPNQFCGGILPFQYRGNVIIGVSSNSTIWRIMCRKMPKAFQQSNCLILSQS
jgi:hypothetical protein